MNIGLQPLLNFLLANQAALKLVDLLLDLKMVIFEFLTGLETCSAC